DAVLDQFGRDVMLMPVDAGHFTVNVLVETSPPFFAWLSTFGKSAKILDPQPVVEEMKTFIGKLSEMYADE
ncbi:MAG: WYL domain-containing protein, partial [Clostridia bacterium]|nr:WYL domain-containing protein [Clostridia bacterium]